MDCSLLCCVIALFYAFDQCSAARILGLFLIPGKSHFTCNEAILKSLWKAGHEVTMVSTFPQHKKLANYTDIDMSEGIFIYVGQSAIAEYRGLSTVDLFSKTNDMQMEYCVKLEQIKNFLKSEGKPYDIIITELMDVHCFLPLARDLGIPIIGTVTFGVWQEADLLIGNPMNPSYIPFSFGKYGSKMSFFQRLHNVGYLLTRFIYGHLLYERSSKQMYRKHFQHLEPVKDDIEKSISLMFYNSHHSIFPRPKLPNVIEIGGIHMKKEKPLPQDLEKFINEAKHGAILFTFGSLIRAESIPRRYFEAFKNAFAEIPQRVIWKYENVSESMPDNVKLLDWVPQRDMLAHRNLKAFISHCGQSGVYEAVYTATPVIAVPLFGDQRANAGLLSDHDAAIVLEYDSLTKDVILDAINKIINDSRYADNMKQVSEAFKDRPMGPEESVVYWTEYVLRHNGAAHLRPASLSLSWYQYYLLDVIGTICLSALLIVYIIVYVVKHCLKMIPKNDAIKKDN